MWSKGQRLVSRPAAALTRWRPAPATGARVIDASAADPVTPPESAGETGPPVSDEAAPDLEARLADAEARGRADGRRQAEAELEDERRRLGATIAEIAGLRRRVLDAAERDVLEVATGMARRILHRELQLDADILLAMARVALGRLGDQVAALVRLHPEDLQRCSGVSAAATGLTLEADASLPRGGCRLVTDRGECDLGVDAQLDELARLLLAEHTRVDSAALH